jgi:hypothetical protein
MLGIAGIAGDERPDARRHDADLPPPSKTGLVNSPSRAKPFRLR